MDIKLIQNTTGSYSINIKNGDFELTEGFDSAIIVSLLSDSRATSDQVKQPERRRGWMGDLSSPVRNRIFGSYLWLVNQRRLITDNLNTAINYAELALKWMIDDQIASSVVVTGELVPRSGISLNITITSLNGDIANHYLELWEKTGI